MFSPSAEMGPDCFMFCEGAFLAVNEYLNSRDSGGKTPGGLIERVYEYYCPVLVEESQF